MGKNSICIQATNADISRYGTTRQDAGLWCQFQIDGNIQFVTDNSWHTATASYLLPGQFRISPSMGFVETQNLQKFPSCLLYTSDAADE